MPSFLADKNLSKWVEIGIADSRLKINFRSSAGGGPWLSRRQKGYITIGLTMMEDNLTSRWIDIEGNDIIVSSYEPYVSLPVCCDPIDNGCVNIGITRAAPYARIVHLSMVNGEIHLKL